MFKAGKALEHSAGQCAQAVATDVQVFKAGKAVEHAVGQFTQVIFIEVQVFKAGKVFQAGKANTPSGSALSSLP